MVSSMWYLVCDMWPPSYWWEALGKTGEGRGEGEKALGRGVNHPHMQLARGWMSVIYIYPKHFQENVNIL